jgi:DNA repair protein RadD
MPGTPADLLRASGKAKHYVTPAITEVVDRLIGDGRISEPMDDADIAIASIGNSNRIIAILLETGALPGQLSAKDSDRLCARTGLSGGDWANPVRTTLAYAEIASFLGLPALRSDAAGVLPDRAAANYPLFGHQRKALRRVADALGDHGTVLLHMPTGAGKTRTAMNAVCETLRREEGKAILWIATVKELLEQAALEFGKAWGFLGDRSDVRLIHAYGSRDWDLEGIDDGVMFATPQTLRYRHQAMMSDSQSSLYALLAEKVSLIVFDEAHQSTAETYREVLEGVAYATYPSIGVLGLSATPGRTYLASDEDYALIDLFHGVKVTLDTSDSGYDNPVDYLIGCGYLAQPEFRLLGEIPDLTDGPLQQPMDTVDYAVFVVEAVLDLVIEGHTRIIVFARSVEESELIGAALRVAGVAAAAVGAGTSAEERDTAAREFKAPGNTPRVLVNFGVYTAGFDAPRTSAVVIARPVRSLVAYSQMVGRGIRGVAAGGNEHAVVATVVDPSEPAFGSIATAFTNWNEMWK